MDSPSSLKKSVSVWRGDLIVPFSSKISGPQSPISSTTTTTHHLTSKRFFNNWIVRYETHPDGHPKSIVATDDKGKIITDCHYVWSPDGKLQTRILNGILHEYKYDALGRLTEVNKTQAPTER